MNDGTGEMSTDRLKPRPWRPTPAIVLSWGVHAAAVLAILLQPARWVSVLFLVWLDHVALMIAGLTARSVALGPNIDRLPDRENEPGMIALTFDDGPDPEATPRILELLAAHDVHATFFLIGRQAERYPELVRGIARAGHTIGNHTWRHSYLFPLYPPSLVAREIDRTQDLITELTGTTPRFFRAPAGVRPPWLEPALARRGLDLVSWSCRGFDSGSRSPESVLRRVLTRLTTRDIVLLHDGRWRLERGRKPVAPEILEDLLVEIRDRGLVTTTLSRALPAAYPQNSI